MFKSFISLKAEGDQDQTGGNGQVVERGEKINNVDGTPADSVNYQEEKRSGGKGKRGSKRWEPKNSYRQVPR